MAYYLDLFSPETYESFSRSDRTVSGFRVRQQNIARRVNQGDKFICYMTRLSRWIGVLEVLEGPFVDKTPLFYPEDDPFIVRFHVRPLVWLPVDKAIPIHEDHVWNMLSFTKGQSKHSSTWTGKLRGSLVRLDETDGSLLETIIREQMEGGKTYPVDPELFKRLSTHRVSGKDKKITVTVPDDRDGGKDLERPEVHDSIRIQAKLAEVGSRMGMDIWVPRGDRSAVLTEWSGDHPPLLERLPLNYDETTLRTIELIDVLWLKGRSIKRAFEVEHSTSVYSGILRMADLLALQPNMDIKLHIVAPSSRRNKVFQELRRPVFSLLERGPLSELCTYLSYESVIEIANQRHLSHLSDSVLEEYEEEAED